MFKSLSSDLRAHAALRAGHDPHAFIDAFEAGLRGGENAVGIQVRF